MLVISCDWFDSAACILEFWFLGEVAMFIAIDNSPTETHIYGGPGLLYLHQYYSANIITKQMRPFNYKKTKQT